MQWVADIEAGEVGHVACLYHVALVIEVVGIAGAGFLFAADPQLQCQDHVPLQGMRIDGGRLLGAGAAQCHNRHCLPSRPSALTKQDQGQDRDLLQEVQLGRRVWSHMTMVLHRGTSMRLHQEKLKLSYVWKKLGSPLGSYWLNYVLLYLLEIIPNVL